MPGMVDVSTKEPTLREAVAKAVVKLPGELSRRLRDLPKGDAVEVAKVAGIMAAKRTPELVPLCHPIELGKVDVQIRVEGERTEVVARVRAFSRTGVEMEAMVAASVAALTIYDMVKGTCRDAEIAEVRLVEKRGGKSGTWRRDEG